MKLIGVLGGTSWPSTMLPYRMLNEEVQRRLGRHHSARIALYSIDYAEILDLYDTDWKAIPAVLKREIGTLLSFRPDCWMIANNTLHKIYDQIAPEIDGAVPFFHAIELVRGHLVERAHGKVLLLGTKFTMEDGYYADPLRQAGIDVAIPALADREKIRAIQARLADGEVDPGFAAYFADLLLRHHAQGCEAVVTGCTELPLVITRDMTSMAVVDPLELQCRRCVDYALDG